MARLAKVLLLLAFCVYPLWLHSVIAQSQSGGGQLLLVFMPLLLGTSWVLFRSVRRVWWPLLGIIIGALVAYLIIGEHERIGLIAVNGIAHASLNLFLLWFFGHTLFGGREPLITRFARLVQGQRYLEVVNYTRYVTLAWSIFFATQVIISALLYFFASITAWSYFVNVLNLPLLALMFIGEYVYRGIAHPNHPRTSIWKSIEIFGRDFAAPRDSKHP